MKKLLFVFAMMITSTIFAQNPVDKITSDLDYMLDNTAGNEEVHIWVFFTDKGNNLDGYFNNPTLVVSEKSLQRRSKVLDANSLISLTDLPVNENYISQLQNSGFKVKHRTKWLNGVSGWATKQEIQDLTNLSYVKELDLVHKYKTKYETEEELIDNSSPFNQSLTKPGNVNVFDYGEGFVQVNQIKVPDVHNMGYTGQGITICSMDAGFSNLSHEVFNSMNFIAMWDFVDNDPDVSGHSHGTATLSTLGGFKEGQLIGPAFGSDFILARTEDDNSETPIEEDNWIAAVEWADSIGVDVTSTSTSLSYLEYDPPHTSYTWEDMDGNTARITIAADLAVKWGIFVVNSASNSGYNPTHNTLGAPADGDSVVTSGSVTSSGQRSSFSSVGPTFDGRIKPDLMTMGSNVYVARTSSPTSYGNSSGTSFSCPILAGASALILSVDPTLTPMELLDLLRQTASQSNNPDNLMGWGIINTLDVVNLLNPTIVENEIADNFYILRNYPNPFNPSTKVQFSVPQQSDVKITLHDMLGRELKLLFDDKVDAGMQEFVVDAGNFASGVYLVRMITGTFNKTIKISLLK